MKITPLIHIVRLARRLNTAAAKENKSSLMSTLDDYKAVGEFAYKFLLFVGIMPIFGYLLVSIQFFPSGVTIGDGFFFLMVALAFGFAYLLFILFGFLIGQLLLKAWSWLKVAHWPKFGQWVAGVIGFLILMAGVFFFHGSDVAKLLGSAVVGFSLAGICLVFLIESLDRPASNKYKPWFINCLWFGVLVFPLVFSPSFIQRMNENVVMKNVGLRLMDVTLKLSEENYNILASAAGGRHLAALGCNTTSSGQPERLVHGVNLLWHGVGERSLVEIPSTPASPSLIVELKREGVFAIRNYGGDIERCLELSGDVLFNAGSSKLSSGEEDLNSMLKVISLNKDKIEDIHVIGHADALGYAGGPEKNNLLALERAQEIKKRIDAAKSLSEKQVTAEGHGAREPKTLCKDWPVKETLSECLAVNRRVEVRMKFKPVPPAAVESSKTT